jgi:hypothetical protein
LLVHVYFQAINTCMMQSKKKKKKTEEEERWQFIFSFK